MNKIPAGAWILALSLSKETTEESLQAFLYERGMDVPLENISVSENPKGNSALVSIPNATGAVLVNWVINGDLLDGRRINFAGWEARGVPRTESGIGYCTQDPPQ